MLSRRVLSCGLLKKKDPSQASTVQDETRPSLETPRYSHDHHQEKQRRSRTPVRRNDRRKDSRDRRDRRDDTKRSTRSQEQQPPAETQFGPVLPIIVGSSTAYY